MAGDHFYAFAGNKLYQPLQTQGSYGSKFQEWNVLMEHPQCVYTKLAWMKNSNNVVLQKLAIFLHHVLLIILTIV